MLFDIEKRNGSIIKVIGVGGGGSNAVSHMYKQGIIGVDFAICNTDSQALESSVVPTKIHLGPSLTEGMGAGAIPEIGKQSCIESIDDVRKFLDNGTKMLFVTAGMGGGTGTGAAPIIAKAAKELDILTVGIVTLPFKFEGIRRTKQALEGLAQMKKNVDSILVISNDKLREFGDLTLTDAFAKADDVLTTAAKGIAEIITKPGTINVDFKDVSTVMSDSGVAIMGHAEVQGENRARRAVDAVLKSPLLEDNDIRGAKNVLVNISSGDNEVTMDELGEITDYIQEEAGFGTFVIWGNCKDESLGEKISITLIATGFDSSAERIQTETVVKEVKKVPLDPPFYNEEIGSIIDATPTPNNNAVVIDFDAPDLNNTLRKIQYNEKSTPKVVPSQYEESLEPTIRKAPENEQIRREYLRSSSSVPLDNPGVVSELENIPAYERRKVVLDDISDADKGISRYSVSFDETDNPIIERKNSYLHDNVD